MQSMDSLDSSKRKTLFKKRTHRPWSASLLETTVEETLSPPKEPTPEVITYVENKEKSQISIGGFLQPHNMFSENQSGAVSSGNPLLNELNHKEKELLSLSETLNKERADERVQELEILKRQEEEARREAEIKALCAAEQVKKTSEQAFKTEQQLLLEQRLRLEAEAAARSLEAEIQHAQILMKNKEQIIQKECSARIEMEEKMKAAQRRMEEKESGIFVEINAVKATSEQKIRQIEIETQEKIQRLHQESSDKIKAAEEQALVAKSHIRKHLEAAQQAEAARQDLEGQLHEALEKARTEKAELESQLQALLEKTHKDINIPMENEGSGRIFIGGFLHSTSMVSESSLESGPKENRLLKEEGARKEAETKALYAIQQAKQAAEQAYKAEQQLLLEKKLRMDAEKSVKSLETRIQQTLSLIESKEQLIQKESFARLSVEENIKQLSEQSAIQQKEMQRKIEEKEKYAITEIKTIKIAADQKIAQIELQSNEKIKQIQEKTDETVKQIHKQTEIKIQLTQGEADRRIREAQEKARLSEEEMLKRAHNERLEFEGKFHKLLEEISQLETHKIHIQKEKSDCEEKLSSSMITIRRMESILVDERNLRKILEQKLSVSPARENEAKQKQIENKILKLVNRAAEIEMEKIKITESLSEAKETIRQQEILIKSEKITRDSLENQIKMLEQTAEKALIAEQKIVSLLHEQKQTEQENAKKVAALMHNQEQFFQEQLHKENKIKDFIAEMHELKVSKQNALEAKQMAEQQYTTLASEKQQLLQEKSEAQAKIYELEICKHNEVEARQAAEQQRAALANEKQQLLQEKSQNEAQISSLLYKTKELELILEGEKYLRQEAERLKIIEEQAKKAAQEKISHAIAEANRTVLNALGGVTSETSSADT